MPPILGRVVRHGPAGRPELHPPRVAVVTRPSGADVPVEGRLVVPCTADAGSPVAVPALVGTAARTATRIARPACRPIGVSGHRRRSSRPRWRSARGVSSARRRRVSARWLSDLAEQQAALRAGRAALPRPALRGRDADDAQPGRRRGPGAGDLPEGVRRLPPVRGGHQPQGLAVPDPHEHVHQLVPAAAAPARPGADRGDHRLAARRGGVAHLERPAVGRDRGAGPAARQRRQGGAAEPAGGVPAGRLPRRRRGLLLQGDRRHHGHARSAP